MDNEEIAEKKVWQTGKPLLASELDEIRKKSFVFEKLSPDVAN